jgi:zinc D-Ala-D-Ala carboxypeptidase
MKRRDFLQIASLTSLSGLTGCSTLGHLCRSCFPVYEELSSDLGEVYSGNHQLDPVAVPTDKVDDLRARSDYFDREFPSDVIVKGDELKLLIRLAKKLDKVQRYVGHGNFNILGYNEALHFSGVAPGIEAISNEEKRWLEKLFYFDAKTYGFMGEKIFTELDDGIKRRDAIKVPYTGHFLLTGPSYETYQRLAHDVGEGLILTSGVRSLAKQFHLFLEKARETKGNLSRASRSLAPPGYSFHGRGDFDVGQVGGGLMNFTDQFSETPEFKRLIELGYIDIRYEQSNLLGVRFEPWHIKVEA